MVVPGRELAEREHQLLRKGSGNRLSSRRAYPRAHQRGPESRRRDARGVCAVFWSTGISLDQFRQVAEQVAGASLADFWSSWISGMKELDYGTLSTFDFVPGCGWERTRRLA